MAEQKASAGVAGLYLKVKSLAGKKLFKSFSVYVFSTVFNQGVSFLLIPFFTHYLLPSEYGTLSLVNTTVSLLTIFIMVGADGAIRRAFYKLKGDDYSSFFSSAFFTCIVAFGIISVLTGLFVLFYPGDTGIPMKWLLLSPVIAFTSVLPTILLGQFRVKQQAVSFAVVSNLMTIANLGLAIWFVAGMKMGYDGRLSALLIVNIFFFVLSYFILRRQRLLGAPISKEHCRGSLRYGLPIIPHHLGASIIAFSDRYFIAGLVDVPEVGIYNVAYMIGSIVGIVESSFSYAFIPFLFESLTDGSDTAKKKVVRLSYFFLAFLAVCVLGLYLTSGLLYDFFIDEDYHSGRHLVIWVAIGYFFSGCYKVFSGYIFYSGKTIYLTYLAIINIVVNVGLNYLLIGNMGSLGAAIATMISFFVMFCITAVAANKLQPMPWLAFLRKNIRS